jgi:hypothetical protein
VGVGVAVGAGVEVGIGVGVGVGIDAGVGVGIGGGSGAGVDVGWGVAVLPSGVAGGRKLGVGSVVAVLSTVARTPGVPVLSGEGLGAASAPAVSRFASRSALPSDSTAPVDV